MIIQSIYAENLLKYRHLELNNIPNDGIIAISGHNESGKSSIGEAICFALFGRTFAVTTEDIQKLIRWGEHRCLVTLRLRFRDGSRYILTRSLDRDHNHSARLARMDDPDRPLARGKQAVADAIRDLLGYDFNSFIESFYLAQREITTPHPQGHAIHVMAGIAPLVTCSKELREDMLRDQAAMDGLNNRNSEIDTQQSDLAFDIQRTHVLTADQVDLANRQQDIKTHRQVLGDAMADYQKREIRRYADHANLIMLSRLRLVAWVASSLNLAGWAWLFASPDCLMLQQATAWLANFIPVPTVCAQVMEWFLYGGLASLGLTFLSWVFVVILNRRTNALCNSGKRLAEAMVVLDNIEPGLPKVLRQSTTQAANVHSQLGRIEPEVRIKLRRYLPEGQVVASEAQEAVAVEDAWLEQIAARISKRQDDIYQEIRREHERRQTHDRLANMKTNLQKEEKELKRRIELRIHADELLHGAVRHLTHQFNHHLRNLAGRTLPMFTDNRYQHLQIDEDFTIRAFSNEKHDFMELDEVSSGTQRQMMLALRLSMAQQMVDRVVHGRQFIFLDEPFAFFDEERTRSTLKALPHLSNDITQIWIVAQHFPTDIDFALSVRCDCNSDEYRIDKS